MSDWRIEALAEITDMRRRLFELKHLIADSIQHDEFIQKIATLSRARDEAQASTGGDAGEDPARSPRVAGVPCSDVHPDYGAATHQFCQQQCSGGMCCDDDPPSREP